MNWPLTGSGVPILSKQELEYVADQYTQAFSRFDGKDNAGFSVLKFAVNFLRKTVSFEHLSNNSCILGISVFINNTQIPIYQPATGRVEWKPVHANAILLDKSIEPGQFTSVTKARFTLMHESAHQILHGDFYRKLATRKRTFAMAYSMQGGRTGDLCSLKPQKLWTDFDWIEWQANFLASAILMPAHRIWSALKEYDLYDEYRYKVDAKLKESQAYKSLLYRIASLFRVSEVTAQIRLKEIGFERLDCQYVKKPDPFGSCAHMPRADKEYCFPMSDEEVLNAWEERFLDPDSE